MLSGVPQGSVLGLLLFNVFINGLCSSFEHSSYFLFADIKVCRTVSSAADCAVQRDNDSIRGWCAANYKFGM